MSKTRRHSATMAQPASKMAVPPLLIGIVVAAAILMVVGLIVLGNLNNQPTSTVEVNQFPALGQANAPVTIVEYSDYHCPHCRDFELETFPKIQAEYIDTGKVRFVAASFHLWPQTAVLTEAALCAGDQDKFFEYGHMLFENQETIGPDPGGLADLAAGLGLNRETFAQCLANGTHRAALADATRAAQNRGVSSTPTFFINNRRVDGNQPYETFKQIIEQELAKAQ